MIITVLLWVVIIIFGFIFMGLLFDGSVTSHSGMIMVVTVVVIILCVNGLDRNEASQACDTINELGGQAAFTSGKCIIKNDGGFPIDKESDRFVYLTQP